LTETSNNSLIVSRMLTENTDITYEYDYDIIKGTTTLIDSDITKNPPVLYVNHDFS